MSYKFDDDNHNEDTVWVWRLTVETTGPSSNSVHLTNDRYVPSLSPNISSEGTMFLVAKNLDEAVRLLGNRLLNAERLGPVFDPGAV